MADKLDYLNCVPQHDVRLPGDSSLGSRMKTHKLAVYIVTCFDLSHMFLEMDTHVDQVIAAVVAFGDDIVAVGLVMHPTEIQNLVAPLTLAVAVVLAEHCSYDDVFVVSVDFVVVVVNFDSIGMMAY